MDLLRTSHADWLAVDALPETAPVASLLLHDLSAGGRVLIVASEAGGGLAGFRLDPGADIRFVNMQPYASTAPALSGIVLETVTLAGQSLALPLGAATGGLTGFAIGADGQLEAARTLDPRGTFPGGKLQSAAILAGDLLAAASGTTLTLHDIGRTTGATGTDRLHLAASEGMFTALAPVGDGLLLAALAGSNEIRSYQVTTGGNLRAVDTFGAVDGAGISTPSALAVASVGTGTYAVLAAAGSDTLTVFAVSTNGALTPTDHVIDSRDTRFEGARQVETLRHGDWSLVLVAGSDGGASLFALLPGGRLFHLHSLSWTNPPNRMTEARGLSALTADITGSHLEIFAAPEGARGLHQVTLDLSGLGAVRQGGGALGGTAGADILIAGGPEARMTGGAGADHFVFLPRHADASGHLGTVLDFTPGEDWLDLSALPFFTEARQAVLRAEGGGTAITVGTYSLTLQGVAPGSLGPGDVIAPPGAHVPVERFVITDRIEPTPPSPPPPAEPVPDRMGGNGDDWLTGTRAAELIVGLGGQDVLSGGGGDDTLDGGAGDDRIEGGPGTDTVVIAAARPTVAVIHENGVFTILSTAGTDRISGVERFRFTDATLTETELAALAGKGSGSGASGGLVRQGTPGADDLQGAETDDVLIGLAGNDRLVGRGGNDTLDGGPGADTLNGGDGDDIILGGAGSDDLRDVIYAGEGNDNIDGGAGNDLIYGQGGNDTIAGGFGVDELQGQEGDDVITGSAYSDLVFGGAGNDFVNGGFGYDRINGGTGADRFYHLGIFDHGSDWVQDYNAAEGDVLVFGNASATADQFQINLAHTANAEGERSGDDAVQEAFVIYKPTGQIIWALVDGEGQSAINLDIGGDVFDLLT